MSRSRRRSFMHNITHKLGESRHLEHVNRALYACVMYVYTYACMDGWMDSCVYVYIHVCTCMYVFMHVYVCMHLLMYGCMYVSVYCMYVPTALNKQHSKQQCGSGSGKLMLGSACLCRVLVDPLEDQPQAVLCLQ
jgi:hypothetical protein